MSERIQATQFATDLGSDPVAGMSPPAGQNRQCFVWRSMFRLKQAATERLCWHPDHAIVTSFSGDLTGARVLAVVGDDQRRFVDVTALKAYVGPAWASAASTVNAARRTVLPTSERPWKSVRCAFCSPSCSASFTPHPWPTRLHPHNRGSPCGDRPIFPGQIISPGFWKLAPCQSAAHTAS